MCLNKIPRMGQTLKKTIELDERVLKKVRLIFEAKTDQEAVNRALYLIMEEDDIIRTHQSLAKQADLKNVFS